MIPYVHTPLGVMPTFVIFIVIGILSLFMIMHLLLLKAMDRDREECFIFPKIVICGVTGYLAAGVFDSMVKVRELGRFKISGVSFYGGLIGSVICFYLLLKCSSAKTQYSIKQWYNLMTLPFLSFHFFGRLGCFFAGCCYGKATNSFLGVRFPDSIEQGVFHHGIKCYPTQLFEAFSILIIFAVVLFVQKKFEVYLILYAISRYIIEFFRGDDRGYILKDFSPSQMVSIILLLTVISYMLICKKKDCDNGCHPV